jgi:hypothetical protein
MLAGLEEGARLCKPHALRTWPGAQPAALPLVPVHDWLRRLVKATRSCLSAPRSFPCLTAHLRRQHGATFLERRLREEVNGAYPGTGKKWNLAA